MPYSRQLGYRAERSNAWSGSKHTNQNQFSPQDSEVSRVLDQNYNRIFSDKGLFIKQFPCHPDLVSPLSKAEVHEALEIVPQVFIKGLNAIFLLRGSKKQALTFRGCWAYGFYYPYYRTIILNPFPRKYRNRKFKNLPKPSTLQEYKRAGATIVKEKKGWTISFDRQSLKTFYRRDVLIHEIGHHVDRNNFRKRSSKRNEGFAEWFATHYGFKYRG